MITYKEKNSRENPDKEVVDCGTSEKLLPGLSGNGQYTVTIQTIHPDTDAGGEDSEEKETTQWTCESFSRCTGCPRPTIALQCRTMP